MRCSLQKLFENMKLIILNVKSWLNFYKHAYINKFNGIWSVLISSWIASGFEVNDTSCLTNCSHHHQPVRHRSDILSEVESLVAECWSNLQKKNKKYIIIEKCVLCLREGDPDLWTPSQNSLKRSWPHLTWY